MVAICLLVRIQNNENKIHPEDDKGAKDHDDDDVTDIPPKY